MTIEKQAQDFETMLDSAEKVTIISHFNPDGDAIGSAVGMREFLAAKGQDAHIIMPSPEPAFLSFLDPDDTIIYFSENKELAKSIINDSDLIVCLDFNKPERTEWMSGTLISAKAEKVMIDHHLHPAGEIFSIVISDPEASSTCELLYRILMAFSYTEGDPYRLGLTVLTALAAGLLTDTNNFNNSVTPYTFTAAASMLQAGVDFDYLNNMLFKRFSESRMRLMGHLLKDSMILYPGLKASFMTMTMDDRTAYGIQDGDTEGFVNLPLMIHDVEISAFFSETPDFIKVSLRSKGHVSVNSLARKFFNGGGHERAAGGRLYIPISDVRGYFVESLEQFLLENGKI